jgi:hypothetical protein
MVARGAGCEDGEDPVRRRQLLASLVVTAAAAAGSSLPGGGTPEAGKASSGELLITRVRDAMLGLDPVLDPVPAGRLRAGLAVALADFHGCRYGRLARTLPRLISSGHAAAAGAPDDAAVSAVLAEIYTLTTRMLIKLDDQQLGWMAADRARVIASAADDPLVPPRLPGTWPSWPAKPGGTRRPYRSRCRRPVSPACVTAIRNGLPNVGC